MKKLNSYVINNDTDMYAVVIDDQFQLFLTEAETGAIREEIFRYSGGSNHIQDTAFNFFEVLAPRSRSTGRIDGEKLSECTPCNLMTYMETRRAQIEEKVKKESPFDWRGFFGE